MVDVGTTRVLESAETVLKAVPVWATDAEDASTEAVLVGDEAGEESVIERVVEFCEVVSRLFEATRS